MKRTALEIYALAVCFVALSCLAIFLGVGVWHIVGISCPEFMLKYHVLQYYQSDEAFRSRFYDKETKAPGAEELKNMRLESYASELRGERREHFQDLVQNIIGLEVALVMFLIHWRLARRVRASSAVA